MRSDVERRLERLEAALGSPGCTCGARPGLELELTIVDRDVARAPAVRLAAYRATVEREIARDACVVHRHDLVARVMLCGAGFDRDHHYRAVVAELDRRAACRLGLAGHPRDS